MKEYTKRQKKNWEGKKKAKKRIKLDETLSKILPDKPKEDEQSNINK